MVTIAPNIIESDRNHRFNELLDEILRRRLQPEDKYEITATLESMGWNDIRAAESFGVQDVFALADDLWTVMQKKVIIARSEPLEEKKHIKYSMTVVRSFLRGIIFSLPMALSVFSMLTLRFSLWSYEYLSLELATSIAIGTILNFMVIGGFTQAIARRGFSYIKQGYYNIARRITFYFVKAGYIVCLTIAVCMLVFNLIFEAFSYRMMSVIILYFFFLSTIWLSLTVMYILEKELTFTGLIAVGIGIVFILFKLIKLDILLSQVIALAIVASLGMLIIVYSFWRAEKTIEKGIAPSMPRMSIIFYSILPFFTYGFIYFTFLFADRVIAWSTNDIYMPYLIWFRGEYELGLDFGLIMLIIPMGFNEVVVNKLMSDLEISQKNIQASHTADFNRMYLWIYYKRLGIVSLISALCAIAVYCCIQLIVRNQIDFLRPDLMTGTVTNFVLVWALAGYTILVVALMNSVILFSFSQPKMVVEAVLIALAVNSFIGFLLSRRICYYYAVFGLLAGAVTFVLISSLKVIKVLKDLDYYLYVAS